MWIGATRNNIPSLRSMLLRLERAECFAGPRALAVDYCGQKTLSIEPRRAGTSVDRPNAYERLRCFYAAAEQATFGGIVPIFIGGEVVI